jgi:hypothetical protein
VVAVTVSVKVAVRVLLLVVLAFIAADLVGAAVRLRPLETDLGLAQLFDVDSEASVPTWFSGSLLLTCAALLLVAALQARNAGERQWRNWAFLACLLLAMSVDEVASYHESWITPLREALGASGLLYLTWVVPGIVTVVLLSLSQVSFVRSLPAATARRFVAAAALYVSGSLGMEMVGGAYVEGHGSENWVYASMVAVEELLELLGAVTLLWALALHLASRATVVHVRWRD